MTDKNAKIIECFSSLTDPRITKKTNHKLIDILVITICGVICNADKWTEIESFGNAKYDWFKTFLELPNGIPSHDTFGRVFAAIDIVEFEKCFLNWTKATFKNTGGQIVAIDGKTLRGSYDRASNKAPIHMVNAWAFKNGITLGQVKTEAKSNEITAIPELLKLLELKGCIVTIDAMGCQKKIAKDIVEKEADYVLSLKGNHSTLHNDVKLLFEDAYQNNFKDLQVDYYKTIDGDHGRIETREYWITEDINWLPGKENWAKLTSIGMVRSYTEIGDDIRSDTRYYICSIEGDAKQFAQASRGHWSVENSLHWVLDIAFREDDSRIRSGNAPGNLSILRNIALNLLKNEKTAKMGIESKRKRAGWDNDYLLKVLCANA